MSFLSVEEALQRVLGAGDPPVETQRVALDAAAGRTLAEPLAALRTQPPFPASVMDGYALRAGDLVPGARLRLIGTAAAGHAFSGAIGPGEAVRIFTGAPIPPGADAVLIQEDAQAADGFVTAASPIAPGRFIRPVGFDFHTGEVMLAAGRRLDARALALAAAMGHPTLPVFRAPLVAILATGDELVRPGEPARADQIVASNVYGVAAMAQEAGARTLDLGIASDDLPSLERAIAAAEAAQADVLVTLGGASVGDHDLVRAALGGQGMELGFWRIAMRPGKPLIFGRLRRMRILGLPGNPVSSLVCARLFLMPLLRALQGDPLAGANLEEPAILGCDVPANDARQDYLRARLLSEGVGLPRVDVFTGQDSSLLGQLARADCLLVREPHAAAAHAGAPCRVIRL